MASNGTNGTNGTKNDQDNEAKKIGTRVFKKSSPNGKVKNILLVWAFTDCYLIILDAYFVLDNHLFG